MLEEFYNSLGFILAFLALTIVISLIEYKWAVYFLGIVLFSMIIINEKQFSSFYMKIMKG